jgi:hypothetical protein
LDISIGIGNGSFSSHNNAENATGFDNKIIFLPAVTYHLKNGFSFGATAFITSDSAKGTELYQTGLTAAYDHYGKKINTGISYTRFLSNPNKYNKKSLYQNDIYGYIKRAKGVLLPGLSVGYASGKYKEVNRAQLIRPVNGDTLNINDSTDNKANYFSVSASVGHEFSFLKIFSKNDELDFSPSLLLNFGSDKLTTTHTNKTKYPNSILVKRLLEKRKKREVTNKFQAQSIAASFDFTYGVGKFFLQPNLYLDYYLPETTTKRCSAIFAVTAGFSF